MTDQLAERLSALADLNDDSDWLEVRRRAKRSRARTAVLAVLAAVVALFAAAAVAAGNGWLFSSHDRQVTAVTHVAYQGQTWRVSLSTRSRLTGVCIRLVPSGGRTLAVGCTATSRRPLAPPFGARHVDVAGGQIWAGTTVGFARRIAITDANGQVHTTPTIPATRGTRTPFRYWVLPLDHSTARSITAYDARGRAITRTLG